MGLTTLVIAGVVTWALRASFILGPGVNRPLPHSAERIVSLLRPAILGALVASAFLARGDGDVTAIPPSWLLAGLATVVVARVHGSLAVAAGAGLALVLLASAI